MRRDENGWSISLGSWGGVAVRVHILSLIFVAVTLFFGWRESQIADNSDLGWIAVLALSILAMSVLWHEAGHYLAVLRWGGQMTTTVIWPLGGLIPPVEPRDTSRAMGIHFAGVFANLAVCIVLAPMVLAFSSQPSELFALLNPLAPTELTSNSGFLLVLKLTFWVNWLLAIINLIPAYPFDGGRALRAGLSGLWFRNGRQHADRIVARVAFVSGLAMFVLAWFARNVEGGLLPAWFALVLLGIFLLFSTRQESPRPLAPEKADEQDLFGYDFSEGYTSLERTSQYDEIEDAGPIAQWVEHRRLLRQQQQQQAEEADDQRMDEILSRVHREGLSSLSREDRDVLDRVSMRYRNRSNNST
ncbi:MAG: site-2 protease family protein [bacterium]|nr:site-2 protease family protein [bacterium]